MSTFKCLKNNGFSFVTILVNYDNGKMISSAINYLKAAKSAGLTTDIVFIPCRG